MTLLTERLTKQPNLQQLLDMVIQSNNTPVFDNQHSSGIFFPTITDMQTLHTALNGFCFANNPNISDIQIDELNKLIGIIFNDFSQDNARKKTTFAVNVLKKHKFALGDLACRLILEQDNGVFGRHLTTRCTLLLGVFVTHSITKETSFAEICKIYINDELSVQLNSIFDCSLHSALYPVQALQNNDVSAFQFDEKQLKNEVQTALEKRSKGAAREDVVNQELNNLRQQYETLLKEQGDLALMNTIFQSLNNNNITLSHNNDINPEVIQNQIETLLTSVRSSNIKIDISGCSSSFDVKCTLNVESDCVIRNAFNSTIETISNGAYNADDLLEVLKSNTSFNRYHDAFAIRNLDILTFKFTTENDDNTPITCKVCASKMLSKKQCVTTSTSLIRFSDGLYDYNKFWLGAHKDKYKVLLSLLTNSLLKLFFDNNTVQTTLKWQSCDNETYYDFVNHIITHCVNDNIFDVYTPYCQNLNIQFNDPTERGHNRSSTQNIKLAKLQELYAYDDIQKHFNVENGSLKFNLHNPIDQQVYYFVNPQSQLAEQLQTTIAAFKIMNVQW